MEILVGERGQGKTTRLIEMSAAGEGIIVTFSEQAAKYLKAQAKEMDLKIPDPIGWDEFIRSGRGRRGPYLLDELGVLLRHFNIETATIGADWTIETLPSISEHYGDKLAAEIREKVVTHANRLSEFDTFVLNKGHRYRTRKELDAGYERHWKAARNILISLDEFITEAGKTLHDPASDQTIKVYEALVNLVEEKKLRPGEVFDYARYYWCLNSPEAIIAYQIDRDKWAVNNCDTEITKEEAQVKVFEEWGFETGRVHIIGTPYYDATDYQFIRFNCGHMAWLWANGDLLKVYC